MGKIKRRAQKIPQPIQTRLIPPVKYWDEDLPDTAAAQNYPPQLIRVNEINDTWMEFPRYENHGWWGLWFVGFVTLFSFCYFLFSPYVISDMFSGLSGFFFYCWLFFSLFSCVLFWFRVVLFEPRGAPVRFNRKRQKVYVYEYQRHWNPWKRWFKGVKVFDWADIHAERVQMAGHADWGHRIYCAVCKPGTYEVVDRFILTWSVGSIYEAYGLWSHCCHYMEAKPVPKNPLYTDIPRSWTPFNTIRWPEDIDRESRTVPDDKTDQTDGAKKD